MNYFDFIVIGVLIVAFYGGYKNGLIKTIFRSAGYILGGVLGLAAAVNYLPTWQNQLHKVVLALLAILLGATLGEYLLGKVGEIFRVVLFLPPFKLIDSALGGALSVIKFGVIAYLISTILVASPIALADKYITPSKGYTYADTHLPKVAKDLKQEVVQLFNKLS